MLSIRTRAIVLGLAITLGIISRFAYRAYKITRAEPAVAEAPETVRDYRSFIRTPKPTTSPSPVVAPAYTPHTVEPVIVKVSPVPTPINILKRTNPCILRIVTYDAKGEPMNQGSGFIAAQGGLVVTNYLVIKGCSSLSVAFEGNRRIECEGIAAVDPDANLAVLKVKGNLPVPLPFATGNLPSIGDKTFAVGNPLGHNNLASEGEVTGVRKESAYLTLIQTTSAISPGCTGGPLVNEDAKVIGVATLYMNAGQKLNLAIDRTRVQKLLETCKGQITPLGKQVWVSNNAEKDQVAYWLAKAAAEAPKMRNDRGRVCSWLAENYARTGDKKGLSKILEFVDTGEAAWQQEANAAGLRARAGDAEAASAALDAATNLRLRLWGHILIANALHERGDDVGFAREIDLAAEIAKTQKDNIVRGDWLVMVAKAAADAAQFEPATAAANLLNDSEDPYLDGKTTSTSGAKRNFKSAAFTHVGIGKAKSGDTEDALAIAEGIFDETDKAFLYMSIAQQRAAADDPAPALTAAQKVNVPWMRNRAMLDTAESFARKANRDQTRVAIADAMNCSRNIKESWRKGEADTRLISTLAMCGDFDSAEKLVADAGDESIRSAGNGSIALAYAKRGDFKKMAESLTKVKDVWAATPALSECAVLQAHAGHLRAALLNISRIPKVDVQMDATRAAIKASGGKLPGQLILDTAAKFPLAEQKAAAYLGLAEAIIERDQSARARTDE